MFLPKAGSKLAWLIFYVSLGIILTLNSFSYLDPDFGWHLRVGERIALEHSVPHDQIYMWSLAGKNWVDHEWLGNLATYGLWEFGGYTAVSIFFILLPLFGLIILNRYVFTNYLKRKFHQSVFAGLELFALIACLPHFGVRLQEFTFVFTILLFIIIDSCCRKQNIKAAYWLLPLLFLWSCIHGGFLFSIAATLGWLAYEIILKLFPLIKNFLNEQALDNKNLKKLIFISLAAILLTLATPYGKELYSFLNDYGQNRYYMSHIEEWRTPYSIPFVYWQILYTQVIIVLFFGAQAYLKNKIPLWKTVLSLGLLILASRSVRHFPLWAVGSLLLIVPSTIRLNLESAKVVYGKYLNTLAIFCFFLIVATTGIQAKFNNNPFTNYCQRYPCGAVQFLKANPQYGNLKMFNDYGWGGFLIWVWPEKKIFIDGRLPQYDFKNKTLLEEYTSFFDKDKIEEKFNEYDIKLVLFKTSEAPFQPDWLEQLITGEKPSERKNPLIEYLKSSPNWKSVYSDSTASVYIKK